MQPGRAGCRRIAGRDLNSCSALSLFTTAASLVEEQTGRVALYGQDDVLRRLALASGRARVVLLTGDSGVGKSTVLGAAQADDSERGIVAPSPTRLDRAGGALQRGLLDQLASATGAFVSDASIAERVGETISEAARRNAADRGQELALVVGGELLALARGRIGEGVGRPFTHYVQELMSASEHTLRARIQAVDADVLATLIAFFEEVVGLAGRPVALALDNGERLRDEDLRQLADLAGRLPDDTVVRVSYAVTGTNQGSLGMLADAGVLQLEVPALTDDAVGEWLGDVGLDPGMAPAVQRVTGGYAMFVGDAIGILRESGSLRDVGVREVVRRSTADSLRGLDIETAVAAQRLAAYADPPPFARVAELVGVDEATWAEMSARLLETRIFTAAPGSQPWFHELRRQAVWAQLDIAVRDTAADAAVADLTERFESTQEPELLVALAMIARHSPQVTSQPSQQAALDASTDEVAIAAAVIELSEPGPAGARQPLLHVVGDSLLVHARDVFGGAPDALLGALARLRERGLLAIISNESASIVVPSFDMSTLRLLAGRAGAELRRMPVQRLATAAFTTTVAPRIGGSYQVRYGLGRPSAADLAHHARVTALRSPADQAWSAYHAPPLAIVRAVAVNQSLFACITFADVAARDDAVGRLQGAREPLLGSEVRVIDVLALPVTRIPAEILLQAAGLVLDQPVNGIMPRVSTPGPLSAQDVAIGHAETLRHVRVLSGQVERYALELEEPVQLAYAGDEHNIELIEIYAGEDGVRGLSGIIPIPWNNPYSRFELRRELRLTRAEQLGLITFGSSVNPRNHEPIIETLATLRQRAIRFNQSQKRLDVPLDEHVLQRLLQTAADHRLRAATMMHDALPFAVPAHTPVPVRTVVLVCPDMPRRGWTDGSSALASVQIFDLPPGSDVRGEVIEVAVMPATTDPGNTDVESGVKERFGLDISYRDRYPKVEGLRKHSYGDANAILARLLGHRSEDIQLRYSDNLR
jgi:hypothetical protein